MQQEILPFKFVMHSLKLQELHKARRRVNDVNLMTTAEISRTPDSASWDEKTRARTHNSAKR